MYGTNIQPSVTFEVGKETFSGADRCESRKNDPAWGNHSYSLSTPSFRALHYSICWATLFCVFSYITLCSVLHVWCCGYIISVWTGTAAASRQTQIRLPPFSTWDTHTCTHRSDLGSVSSTVVPYVAVSLNTGELASYQRKMSSFRTADTCSSFTKQIVVLL